MTWLAVCLAYVASLFASPSVELFLYWQCHRKGDELFRYTPEQGLEELSLTQRIAKELTARGVAIQSWDLDAHRSDVLSWAGVRGWRDLIAWMFAKPIATDNMWVFWSLGPHLKTANFRLSKKQLVLFLWEPPTVEEWGYDPKLYDQFGKVFTWDDDLVDNVKFFKFYYPEMRQRCVQPVPFAEKKFCVMVATRLASKHPKQLYTEREKVIHFFEQMPDGLFDLYGRYWEKRKYKNWRGTTPDKIETIKQYKFSICYENMRDVKGYVTEKIFDCFAAATVPVYWGASNITDFVPPECFVDRRQFTSEQALFEYLSRMEEAEYEQYLSAAEKFLKSEKAKLFSSEHFVTTFVNAVAPSKTLR